MEIRVGVSSCLLGQKVRYDGGHKHDRWITGTLGKFCTLVPVCPEVECGLPAPREPMRLEGDPQQPRLVTVETKVDLTEQMERFCSEKLEELAAEGLCGFVLKEKSPSCGLGIGIHNDGAPTKKGRGLFAAALAHRFPLLPVEEEERLEDMALRENFVERVFTFRRWKDFLQGERGMEEIVAFHTAHKYLVMAHSPKGYHAMGRLVAQGKDLPREELLQRYGEALMDAFSRPATPAKNANVLMHLMGYFKKELSADEKEELQDAIDRYRNGLVPLVVPITLLNRYVRRYDQTYLKGQLYLTPHPQELMLRNHA